MISGSRGSHEPPPVSVRNPVCNDQQEQGQWDSQEVSERGPYG